MTEPPDWVKKHKKKGMDVEKRGNSYYLTCVTSVWDPKKKRARKVTLEYLGRITPEGVIPPKGKRPIEVGGVLEAGNFAYLQYFTRNIAEVLKDTSHMIGKASSLLRPLNCVMANRYVACRSGMRPHFPRGTGLKQH